VPLDDFFGAIFAVVRFLKAGSKLQTNGSIDGWRGGGSYNNYSERQLGKEIKRERPSGCMLRQEDTCVDT
jgi:hypothetical protein